MELVIYDHTNGQVTDEQLDETEKLLQFAADQLSIAANAEMSVTYVNNPEMQKINREYRGIDRSTDVISFAIEDDEDLMLPAELQAELPRELGDLFVSIDKVKSQALFLDHSEERELGYMLVHGFLHLNGYDHERADDHGEQFRLQEEILTKYGLKR
ncbi:Putative metalloprotease [Limosilactobacillus gastricus PS3]|uniref:Endoribonuclease YbeY n=1 Tax=Limosilactobacillus gastricus PS3 TaxID=1144300 RepID=H4GHX5_9LACO|nr:rRNA maturation RNase YbeY [Limosilactobacillus gastricus]EHS87531.1 Putative metalloprotease [Limosilactobacillus gastricus PS3]